MQRDPQTMQEDPHYTDVVAEVASFWKSGCQPCVRRASTRRAFPDPGFGFGKTPDHNLRLLGQLPRLAVDGLPILVGLSRKSTLGAIIGGNRHRRAWPVWRQPCAQLSAAHISCACMN
jgi:dihydropteroate synthase